MSERQGMSYRIDDNQYPSKTQRDRAPFLSQDFFAKQGRADRRYHQGRAEDDRVNISQRQHRIGVETCQGACRRQCSA